MSKIPALQFYPGDWRKDPGIQSLSYHDRGVWFEILCLMHESCERGKLLLGGKPMPEDALARLLGLDKQNLTTTLTTLLNFGVASRDPDSGALINRRMVRDEMLRKIRQNAGKLGGNPLLLNQNPTTHLNQKPTPSSSSSSSSSDNTKRAQVSKNLPQNEEEAIAFAGPIAVPREFIVERFYACMAVGFLDGAGRPIKSWPHYLQNSYRLAQQSTADKHAVPRAKPDRPLTYVE